MELTLDYIKTNFKKFNVKYFNDELIEPMFKIKHIKSFLGQLSWKRYGNNRTDYVISISDYYDRSDKDFCNTLLHEMIHLHIRQNNIKDTRPHHGKVFYSIADRINKDGWHISRCDNITGLDIKSKDKAVYNMLAYITFDKKYFLMKYNKKNKSDFVCLIAANHIKGAVWFTSNDSRKYASLPECRRRTVGYYISEKEYNEIADKYKYADVV